MGLLRFLELVIGIAVMVMGVAMDSAKPMVIIIQFHQTPTKYSRFSTAVFQYSIQNPDGTNACFNNGCSISCELDGQSFSSCPPNEIVLKNLTANQKHSFLLNVTTDNGDRNSSSYSWFIDTVPPTARISNKQTYTNAHMATVDITFSEACRGFGGFVCVNSTKCDVILNGPAYINASSLRTIIPDIKYRLDIFFASESLYGHVVIRMADHFCTDEAGNYFVRTKDSITVVHFDSRPVIVDLWMPTPSYMLEINGVPRTILATNNMEDLKVFLEFNVAIRNSTEEVLSALHVTSRNALPVHRGNHGNRKFVFELKNVLSTEIITVELEAGLLVGRTGTPVSPVPLLTILYDSTKPGVGLSTSSPSVTKASEINVVVEFSKPVFGFEASVVDVEGGKLTRIKKLSRALYLFTVVAVYQSAISITIPAGKVNDISGNQNRASNRLEVKHYSPPAISIALHSFVTAGVIATSLTAAALSLSISNLGAIGALASGNIYTVASNPSMNLHGLFGHLQVFVLSDWFSVNHPIEYSETIKGLRWLIPRQKLPWKEDEISIQPNHIYSDVANLNSLPLEYFHHKGAYDESNSTSSSNSKHQPPFSNEIDTNFGRIHGHNISMKSTPYGLPLNAGEYFTYFLRGEPLSASNVIKRMKNYKGWQDMEMNLFWLAVGGGSLVVIHVAIILFLRWRTGTPSHGTLLVPRFELLLLILMLPCISQSSAFVIRGGTTGGIITGVLLLVIPAAFILSIFLFLIVAIFFGTFAQYKEIRYQDVEEPWYTKLWFFFVGRSVTGKWFYKEGLPSSFLLRFGILFENQKGPSLFVFSDQNDPNTMPKWIESSQSGIGRMRAISSDDSSEEINMPLSRRLLGCARSSYFIIDLSRRVGLGIISGASSSRASRQNLFALAITLIQFFHLFALRPYIRRGVHMAECISLLCEIGVFSLSIDTNSSHSSEDRTRGRIMLALLFLTFIAQVINEWYALIKCLLTLSQPPNSFGIGLKFAVKGLLLPFLPRKHWSGLTPATYSKPETGLSSVPPLSPVTEFERKKSRAPRIDSFGAMTATVVPMLSPGSPSLNVTGTTGSAVAGTSIAGPGLGEGKRSKGLKLEQKNEMKKLRELAKASFSGDSKDEKCGASGNPQASNFRTRF